MVTMGISKILLFGKELCKTYVKRVKTCLDVFYVKRSGSRTRFNVSTPLHNVCLGPTVRGGCDVLTKFNSQSLNSTTRGDLFH